MNASCRPTTSVSHRRQQGRWSAQGTPELPRGVERRSGAAVRLQRLDRPRALSSDEALNIEFQLLIAIRPLLFQESEARCRYANQRTAIRRNRLYESTVSRILPDGKPRT
jgi:hypothetical protein